MKRFICAALLMLFAFTSTADETVLGVRGNDKLLNELTSLVYHNGASWSGMPSDGSYTTADNGCAEIIGNVFFSDLEACSHYLTQLRFDRDTTITSWTIEVIFGLEDIFSCSLKLVDGDGVDLAGSEIEINTSASVGTQYTRTLNHFFDASDTSQSFVQVKVKDGSTCSAGSGCSCDASGITVWRIYGVEN